MNGLILCTNECNLRCKYCFETQMRNDKMQSNASVISKFNFFLDNYFDSYIKQLIYINKEILHRKESKITFHGGEPLLIGSELIEKGFNMIRKYPDISILIQTNGALIDDEFIDLFKKYDVKVGISLDGPESIHDAYRKNIGGDGTFELIFNNIKKMRNFNISVGCLATITDMTIKDPEAFYNFFSENGIPFSFNPCITNPNLPSAYNVLNTKDYISFNNRIFDLWINDTRSNLPITCYERILSAMCIKKRPSMEVCTFIPDCSTNTVAIDTEGNFYRCLHYMSSIENSLGNIVTDPLEKVLEDPKVINRWEYLRENDCKDCDIQEYCCGGCPYDAEQAHGDSKTRGTTCESQKAIVHHIYDYLKKLPKAVKSASF